MYCKKCDKHGKIGDIYCSECGTKLERKKIDIKISKKTKQIIISVLAVISLLLISYKTINYIYSPGFVAKKYFEAVINNNTDEIYSYIKEYEDTFVNQDTLKNKIDLVESVSGYKIVDIQKTNNQALVQFEYTVSGEIKTAYVLLYLDGNNFYIFDNWKIESAKLVENVTIKVPSKSKITLDDIDISKYLVDDEDEYYDVYEIPYMIAGEYKIVTELNDIKVEDDINIQDNQTYYINSIELSDEQVSAFENTAKNQINLIYSNAISGTLFDDISNNFNSNNNLEDIYKSLKSSFKNSSIKINSINITDIEYAAAAYDEKGNLAVTFKADYTINYTYNKNNIDVTDEYEGTSNIALSYLYVDNNYELYDINNTLNLKARW